MSDSRMLQFFRRRSGNQVASRFLRLVEAHGVARIEIPRLFASVGYGQVESPQSLLSALTPTTIDAACSLFGVRREWLEGLDGLIYQPFGSGRVSPGESTKRLASAVARAAASPSGGEPPLRGPLAILSTRKQLDRQSSEQQWLAPVIVEPTGFELDGPVYRCRIFGGYFEWSDERQRVGLKALVWLVWHRLHKVVPLYQVEEHELIATIGGELVPSSALRRTIITDPSLEDYIEGSSGVAKEVDELPAVGDFLKTSGLEEHWEAEFARSSALGPDPEELVVVTAHAQPNTAKAPIEDASATKRTGKRALSEAIKEALRAAAKGVWATDEALTITAVVKRLKSIPGLKAAAMSDSAVHKTIRSVAPEGANKPGRRPKKSP